MAGTSDAHSHDGLAMWTTIIGMHSVGIPTRSRA